MRIRAHQIEQLQDDAGAKFIDRLMAHFAPLWPKRVVAMGTGYRAWLQEGVRTARIYGIDTQQLSARFVNLWFVWGRGFEKQPEFEWAREILESQKRSGFVKMHQLSHRTRLELEALEAEHSQRLVA